MSKPDIFDYSLLKLSNLDKANIEEFNITNKENDVVVQDKLTESSTVCPCCESPSRKIKDYRIKNLTTQH